MILVADCSALIALSICNRLDILEQIFGQVLVPIHDAARYDPIDVNRDLIATVR